MTEGAKRGEDGRRRRSGIRPVAVALTAAAALLSGCTSGPLIPPRPIPDAALAGAALSPQPMTAAPQAARPVASPVASAPLSAPASAPVVSPTHRHHRAAAERQRSHPRAHPFPAATAEARHRRDLPEQRRPQPEKQTQATIRFTPVIGAPVSAIEPLSAALEQAARRHGVVIRTTADKPVDAILRGYFSVSKHGSRTRVVYVWDVLDSTGNRLYRISGSETVHSRHGNAWASVPASTMRDIAKKTIGAYLAWRTSHMG